jgi:hypothetical protein
MIMNDEYVMINDNLACSLVPLQHSHEKSE